MTVRTALLRREGVARDGRSFLIRPTTTRDAAAIVALQDAVAAEGGLIAALPGDRGVMEEQMLISSIIIEGGLSLTLDIDASVAGHLLVVRRSEPSQAHVGDVAIIVENAVRGLGLGRTLMETAIDWARAVRLTELSLGVFPTNTRAIKLYRSLGFVDDGVVRRQVRWGDGERDVLQMGLLL